MRYDDFPYEPDAVRAMRINLMPLSAKTFKLNEDLYMNDTLREDGHAASAIEYTTLFKLEACAMLFCRRGTINARINHKDLTLGNDDALIAMPGSIIERLSIAATSEVVMLAFDRETLMRHVHATGVSDFLSLSYQMSEATLSIPSDKMENFVLFYQATRNMLLNEDDTRRQVNIIEGFAHIVISILEGWMASSADEKSSQPSRAQTIVSDFMMDLHRYVTTERELAFYAARAAISPKHLSRVVIQQTGKRPADHIRDYLTLEAKCLLATKKYTIKQISDMLNFSNTSAFTRFFRTATGTTPAAYLEDRKD